VSPELSERITAAIAGLSPEPLGHVNYEGIRYGGLPVFGTIGEVWLLRPDGSFWRVDSDCGLALEPLPSRLHTTAVVAGTERYPWLRELIPPRPADAVPCSQCQGEGRIFLRNGDEYFYCDACGALGWLAGAGEP
jgi:hypothetical protein